jgi:ribonuclease P protein component
MRLRVDDFDVRALLTDRNTLRVGLIVPRYKHTAVDRNRLKRRLRELVRVRLLPPWREGAPGRRRADVVVRALPAAYHMSMADLARRIEQLAAALARRSVAEAGEQMR